MPLQKFNLVEIEGLKSEAGKKLNGGLGIILSHKTIKDDAGNTRYPVRIFSLVNEDDEYDILDKTDDKKIKEENLVIFEESHDSEDPITATFKEVVKLQSPDCSLDPRNRWAKGDSFFWYEASYRLCPQHIDNAICYASALRDFKQKYSEAAEVVHTLFHEQQGNPVHSSSNCDAVVTLCRAQAYMDDALQMALAVPMEPVENREDRATVLELLSETLTSIYEKTKGTDRSSVKLLVQSAQALLDMDPTNPDYCRILGTAFHCAGEYWKGVKWWRKALRRGLRIDLTFDLVTMQLLCPGQPLEEYILFEVTPNTNLHRCVRRDFIDTFRWDEDLERVVERNMPGVTNMEAIPVERPDNPNDRDFFGADFLDKMNAEVEEELAEEGGL